MTVLPLPPLLDRRIDEITEGLIASYAKNLRLLGENGEQNISTIIDYIKALRTEISSLSDHYRKDNIHVLTRFSKFHNNKPFKDITRDDVMAFLNLLRKPESIDPLHKWIGTYNQYKMCIVRFYRWLYTPHMNHKIRPLPEVVSNLDKEKRKEISSYTPSDMWNQQDDLLFLKYCHSKRDRCYHAISRDLSCRPHEILKLKIRDVAFKTIGTSQYAEVVVSGKTTQRPIPLINSIPYLKDYLDHEHPMPSNPNAPLLCGIGRGLGKHIDPLRIAHIYEHYKKKVFPNLLESPNVLPEDKSKIRSLLNKRWNPYVRRHSALTEKSKVLKEHVLRQHAGWSPRSMMHLKYLHFFGNESSESLLEAYGLVDKGIQIDQLRPKQCPNCSEPNKQDSKFCGKCRMIMSYDAYEETLNEQKKRESEVQLLKEKYEQDMKSMKEHTNNQFTQVMEMQQQKYEKMFKHIEVLEKELQKKLKK